MTLRFNGMNVIASPHLPREHIGDEVYSFVGHPLYCWVYQFLFGREPAPTWHQSQPIYGEPKMYMSGGMLLCSPEQYKELQHISAYAPMGAAYGR